MKIRFVFIILAGIISFNTLFCQETIKRDKAITQEEIKYHIKYLSSEKFNGRRTGEPGCDSAGSYIEKEFVTYGLKPVNNNYKQYYEFISEIKPGKNNQLSFSGIKNELKLNTDFAPLPISGSGKVKAKSVFAGYGIEDSTYSDYKNIDIKDKVVFLLTGSHETPKFKDKYSRFASLRYKTMIARDKGAKGIIIIPKYDPNNVDDLKKLFRTKLEKGTSNAGLPVLTLLFDIAKDIFGKNNKDIVKLQENIDSLLIPQSFELETTIYMEADLNEIKSKSFNISGIIEGNDPMLKDQYIVIGGHYDHLGMGGEGSLAPETTALHGGADDNASGTAGVLELAQSLVAEKQKIGRSLLFVSFSGEEEGLLGSAAYIKNPLIPLEKTTAMINMDMIGRLRDKKLIINGAGSAKIFGDLLKKYNKDSLFNLKTNDEGFSPSDNASFYGKNIPVMMFFTDLHPDYHKPADTWDKINYEGEKSILEYIKNITIDLSNEKTRPEFIKPASNPMSGRAMPGFKVTSGIIPQFGEQVEGVKISGAKEGSAAGRAGLKSGDIIVKMGNHTIKNLYDYTYALGEIKWGDKVEVKFIRDGKEMTGIMEFIKK
jgi:aminopeptidase YwaD